MHRLRREFRQLVVLLNEAITGTPMTLRQHSEGTQTALRRHSDSTQKALRQHSDSTPEQIPAAGGQSAGWAYGDRRTAWQAAY